ncbi:MAG TPA: hypothetical protein VM032_16840 [Vicinamibacterales bacterium]|nr:hypothetical protein [Vicinamibacterales bacterium]
MASSRGSLVFSNDTTTKALTVAGAVMDTEYPSPNSGSVIRGNAAQLRTGEIVISHGGSGGAVRFFDRTFANVANVSTGGGDAGCAAYTGGFVALVGSNLVKYGPTGAVLATVAAPVGASQVAVNPAGTFAYVGATTDIIYAVDLASGATTTLVTEATLSFTRDPGTILYLQDDSIVVAWFESNTVTRLRRYSTAGATLWTTSLTGASSFMASMCLGLTAAEFYIAFSAQDTATPSGHVEVSRVDVTTGTPTLLFSKNWPNSGDGFNAYDNCAMWVWVPTGPRVVSLDNSVPSCEPATARARTLAEKREQERQQRAGKAGPILPAVSPAWTPRCTGGGTVPTAADLTTSEDWSG